MPPTTPSPTLSPALSAVDDLRQRLLELRDLLTDQLRAGAPAAYVAPLARQLQAVLRDLAALPPATATDALTLLQQKHDARRAAAGIPAVPSRRTAPSARG